MPSAGKAVRPIARLAFQLCHWGFTPLGQVALGELSEHIIFLGEFEIVTGEFVIYHDLFLSSLRIADSFCVTRPSPTLIPISAPKISPSILFSIGWLSTTKHSQAKSDYSPDPRRQGRLDRISA